MCLVRIEFCAIFLLSIALSAILIVAIVLAAISEDTIVPATIFAEVTVSSPGTLLDAKVTESPDALVLIVTLLPATKVRVSVALSATTLSCPLTAIVLNASVTEPLDWSTKDKVPLPSVLNTCPLLPSVTFNWSIPI